MISTAELLSMQTDAQAAMDQSVTIKRNTPTKTPTGFETPNWSTVATTICNQEQPTGGLLQNYDYLIASLNTWLISVPVGTNILSDDRLVFSSKTMRVMVVLVPESYPIVTEVLAAELSGEAI